MQNQNYKNHLRFYPLHHFIFYPVILAAIVFCMIRYKTESRLEYLLLAFVFFMLGWLSFMMRQHYALGNQNRIIRLEMRLRYYQLTQKRFEPLEKQLAFGQIAALRFASDDELAELAERAVKENLSADSIKRSVKDWQADNMRA